MDERRYIDLQDSIGYHFNDLSLLRQALTHSSYVNEKGQDRITCNERLEFLGDSLLGMSISRLLFRQTPLLTEGEMSKLRAELVCEKFLEARATQLQLGSYLFLGRGEDSTGGRKRASILADAMEALIAAIYLDGGIEPVMSFVIKIFSPYIHRPKKNNNDYKTLLQEYIQNQHKLSHTYKLTKQTGPEHDKTFTVEVLINGKRKGTGTGKSKKEAEQAAAKEALMSLSKQ